MKAEGKKCEKKFLLSVASPKKAPTKTRVEIYESCGKKLIKMNEEKNLSVNSLLQNKRLSFFPSPFLRLMPFFNKKREQVVTEFFEKYQISHLKAPQNQSGAITIRKHVFRRVRGSKKPYRHNTIGSSSVHESETLNREKFIGKRKLNRQVERVFLTLVSTSVP